MNRSFVVTVIPAQHESRKSFPAASHFSLSALVVAVRGWPRHDPLVRLAMYESDSRHGASRGSSD
jgi:hypothetical protein